MNRLSDKGIKRVCERRDREFRSTITVESNISCDCRPERDTVMGGIRVRGQEQRKLHMKGGRDIWLIFLEKIE